jgi:hypothetical protein
MDVMSDIHDEPPDDNEAFANLDESLDDEDALGHGPEGGRDLGTDIVVDHKELQEVGAELDDPEQMAMLDGAMDDPDGIGPPTDADDDTAGWDVDPVSTATAGEQTGIGADGDAVTDDVLVDVPEVPDDLELELAATDPAELDRIPDDAPGSDSARW